MNHKNSDNETSFEILAKSTNLKLVKRCIEICISSGVCIKDYSDQFTRYLFCLLKNGVLESGEYDKILGIKNNLIVDKQGSPSLPNIAL